MKVRTVRFKDLLDDPYVDLGNLLKSLGDVCAIVYCLERTTCDDLAAHLSKNGISCAAYHAGLNNKLRSSVLDDWISSKTQVVVATVAFGMGIDRKDVRIVCHFNIPKSMESFYQESGRAGRDQLPSRSVLYYGMDDRKKMQFILNNESKKSQTSSLKDESSKKSLADFNKMVEYCEESNCRRKKILESFGEQVPVSLCRKTCDTCKHPNVVAKFLEELKTTCALRHRNGSSRIFMSSSSNIRDEEGFSEFWNRDDEATGSEEDISDADDGIDVVKSLSCSSVPPKSRLNEKIEFLQRAEENYYRNKVSDNRNTKPDKNTIPETLRESSKQRLLNAVKQSQQRLSELQIDIEKSANFLENECYKKYGKTGKSFYLSQLASTIRWLSTANITDITSRLSTATSPTMENITLKEDSFSKFPSSDNQITETSKETPGSIAPENPVSAPQSTLEDIKLPPIPSFSAFLNSKNSKDDRLSASKGESSNVAAQKNREKRTRLLYLNHSYPE